MYNFVRKCTVRFSGKATVGVLKPFTVNTLETTVTRSLTSIGSSGDYILEQYTKEEFEKSMSTWEKAMNHYLKTGEVFKGLTGF